MKAEHNMSESEFMAMLNDDYPPVNLAGIEYSFGYILKEVDPIRFCVWYNDYISALEDSDNALYQDLENA
jgi:hypothetical protein